MKGFGRLNVQSIRYMNELYEYRAIQFSIKHGVEKQLNYVNIRENRNETM